MTMLIRTLAVVAGAMLANSAFAQSATPVTGASSFVPTANEPAPKLSVSAPLLGPLARGAALIPYRVENLRILPVLGADAVMLSPRVGHLHVTVDDAPWHWGDFSGTDTLVIVALPPGQHKVLVEVANPEHHILTAQTVVFTVPSPASN